MSPKKPFREKDIKILWGRAHNSCAICKSSVIMGTLDGLSYPIGKNAHIEGENPGSARYNPNLDYPEKNAYDNLILLCPTCHDKTDNDPQTFTVQKLKDIKKQHEVWAEQGVRNQLPDITFAELEVIVNYLTEQESPEFDESLIPLHPKVKIAKNKLSPKVENYIRMGAMQTPLVKDYINRVPNIQFGDRLRNHFIESYNALRSEHQNDDLFYALWDIASGNASEFKLRAAGLAVITYFFNQCDIFES